MISAVLDYGLWHRKKLLHIAFASQVTLVCGLHRFAQLVIFCGEVYLNVYPITHLEPYSLFPIPVFHLVWVWS